MEDEAAVTESVARVAALLSERAGDLAADMVNLYARELPHLVHDDESVVSLLSASLYQNIDTALRIFQHDIDPTRVEAPAAAMEYARRLAQRGTPVIDLIRAYYLGQNAILDHAVLVARDEIRDPDLLAGMMGRALNITFAFIDRVTQQVVSAYQEERDRWQRNQSAVRASRVRALLDGGGADVDASEVALGYRLRGTQLAMVLWYPHEATPGSALAKLENTAAELAEVLPAEGPPLFVPNDELCAWAWFRLPSPEFPNEKHFDEVLARVDPDVRIAVGDLGQGLDGFRRTHRQAQRVYSLAVAAGEHCERALTFREVGAMALMTSDMNAARLWVADTLGSLAVDDNQHERLRETLRVFLSSGGSYTAAASQLTMHKNSVQYRIRKAEEMLGRPVSDHRLDVELALTLCHRLGPAVLAAK